MPVVRSDNAVLFETHGSRFHSYASPSRGSAQLSAWRLEVPAGLQGVAHRPNREEILLMLSGELDVTVAGERFAVVSGDVVVVPCRSELRVDGGRSDAQAWVTTTLGLEAVMADGTTIVPPWAK